MKRIHATEQTWRGITEGRTAEHREAVTRESSLIDGWSAAQVAFWADLDFARAWVDNGPSPAGNPGPYLKAPRPAEGTIHRIYPRSGWQVGDVVRVQHAGSESLIGRIVDIRVEREATVDGDGGRGTPGNDRPWVRVLTLAFPRS